MKKHSIILWYLPVCFCIFLTIFIFVKFIFIFFFNATFEPQFIFDLTPYYLLSGVNHLHLLLLSLIVVGFNAYFHFNINKKNLILSFIPTGIMLIGLGFKIAIQEIQISNVLHYLTFGFFLIIAIVDQRHVLIYPKTTISTEKEKIIKPKSSIEKIESPIVFNHQYVQAPITEKPFGYISADEILSLHKETLSDLRSILKDDLKRAKDLLEELEHRTRKIDILEEEIRNRKYNSFPNQTNFYCPYKSFFNKQSNNYIKRNIDDSFIELKKENNIQKDYLNIDKIADCIVIIKRGILKEVNRSFSELIGFDREFLLEKSLFNFVAPEGLFKIEEYYLNRLKGIKKNSYETIILKNDNCKIQVEITIKPIKFYGETANMAIFRELK